MISFLSGEIRNIFTEKSILEINVAGVGYEVVLPSFVMDDLVNEGKKSGENIILEIYYHSTLVFGFLGFVTQFQDIPRLWRVSYRYDF